MSDTTATAHDWQAIAPPREFSDAPGVLKVPCECRRYGTRAMFRADADLPKITDRWWRTM